MHGTKIKKNKFICLIWAEEQVITTVKIEICLYIQFGIKYFIEIFTNRSIYSKDGVHCPNAVTYDDTQWNIW